MSEETARFIKKLDGWRSDARFFELSRPVKYGWDDNKSETKFVIVSAVTVPLSGPETFIFPAKEDGEVIEHLELNGSFSGGLDHEQALNDAGFGIIE